MPRRPGMPHTGRRIPSMPPTIADMERSLEAEDHLIRGWNETWIGDNPDHHARLQRAGSELARVVRALTADEVVDEHDPDGRPMTHSVAPSVVVSFRGLLPNDRFGDYMDLTISRVPRRTAYQTGRLNVAVRQASETNSRLPVESRVSGFHTQVRRADLPLSTERLPLPVTVQLIEHHLADRLAEAGFEPNAEPLLPEEYSRSRIIARSPWAFDGVLPR